MPEAYEQHFAYHANAIAFGARFSAPGAWEAMGSVALPSIGGRVTASASNYLLDGGFVTVGAAGSEVVGEQLDGPGSTTYRTRALTRIEALRIGPYLEIDELRVDLESRYEYVPGQPSHEPEIRASIRASGVRLCGQCWTVQTTPELDWANAHPTLEAARRAAMAAPPAGRIYRAGPPGSNSLYNVTDQGAPPDPSDLWVPAMEPPAGLQCGPVACPHPGCAQPGATPQPGLWGVALDWPQHANVTFRFGEFVISHGRRRLTAVRMSMTRSPRSELVVGELAINGANYP